MQRKIVNKLFLYNMLDENSAQNISLKKAILKRQCSFICYLI